MLARILRTISYGACALRAADASSTSARPAPRVATTPNSCIRAIMVSTSVTSGTFVSSRRPEPNRAAAICGRAAFFAPRTWTEPSMRLPPRMSNRSMLSLSVLWVFGVL